MSEIEEGAAQKNSAAPKPAWVADLKKYEKSSWQKATWQLFNTIVPYLGLLFLMYLTMKWRMPYAVTLLLALPASALLVRIFIFFHDCTHGSFVANQTARDMIGRILGLLVFTPYADWRHAHGVHHSTSGNLDRRGVGDVWTMTADEYAASPPLRRLGYRLFRNPLVMFGIGPLFTFLVWHRFPARGSQRKQIMSVILLDIVLAGLLVVVSFTIGLKTYLLIQMPIMFIGGAGGVWLFYVQHQFDPSYWARTEDWGSMNAALLGASYYKLPPTLQWISGNIGLHHIHHLRPRIPNYNLQQCLKETPELQLKDPLLLWPSLLSVRLKLWDEKRKLLLTFRQMTRQSRPPNIA